MARVAVRWNLVVGRVRCGCMKSRIVALAVVLFALGVGTSQAQSTPFPAPTPPGPGISVPNLPSTNQIINDAADDRRPGYPVRRPTNEAHGTVILPLDMQVALQLNKYRQVSSTRTVINPAARPSIGSSVDVWGH